MKGLGVVGFGQFDMRKLIVNRLRTSHLLMVTLALWVVAVACGGAKFQVTSLELTPDAVVSGESTTVTATVENTGGQEGTYLAILRVDGQDTAAQQVILQTGETAAITFQLLREIGPSSQVELGGITKTLTIYGGPNNREEKRNSYLDFLTRREPEKILGKNVETLWTP